jgi:hypothetical protein
MALAVIVASLVSGIVAAYLMSLLRPVVGRVSELKALTGRPVLGSISVALTDAARQARRREAVLLGGAMAGLTVLLIANYALTVLARGT